MSYQYSLTTDFNGAINKKNMQNDIINSSIVKTLISININSDIVTIIFNTNLDAGEESTLDTLVTNHNSSTIYATNYFNFAEDITTSSTTSTTYQQKIRLTTENIETGDYKIYWFFNWRINSRNTAFEAQVQLDDSTILSELFEEPYDYKDTTKYSTQGFKIINLTRGIHTIDLDYRRGSSGNATAYIWNANLQIESV